MDFVCKRATCRNEFSRPPAKVKPLKSGPFCSIRCYALARMKNNARWRDRKQINEYHRSYAKRHRAKNRARLQKWRLKRKQAQR